MTAETALIKKDAADLALHLPTIVGSEGMMKCSVVARGVTSAIIIVHFGRMRMDKVKCVEALTFDARIARAREAFDRAKTKYGQMVNDDDILLNLRVSGILTYHEPSDTYYVKPGYADCKLPDDINDLLYDFNNTVDKMQYRMKRGKDIVIGRRSVPPP